MQATMEKILAHLLGDTSVTPQQHLKVYEKVDYEYAVNLEPSRLSVNETSLLPKKQTKK